MRFEILAMRRWVEEWGKGLGWIADCDFRDFGEREGDLAVGEVIKVFS